MTEYERGARQPNLTTYNSKNYAKTFTLANPFEHDPENYFVLAVLTQAGIDNAQAGNTSFNDATLDYRPEGDKADRGRQGHECGAL